MLDNVMLSFPNKNSVFINGVMITKEEFDKKLNNVIFNNIKKYSLTNSEIITDNEKFINENLIINGDNLLALHKLCPMFENKIKLMYWDIPYNTQNKKVPYNDSFKHSSWLTMMKNRLEIAQKLLKDDGSICIHCDVNEMAHLKVLCDEIFDRNNFISIITCKVKAPSGVASGAQVVFDCSEYILIYAKNKSTFTYNHISEDAEIVNEYSKTKDNYKYILNSIDYSKKELVAEIDGDKVYRISLADCNITTMGAQTALDYYNSFEKIFATAALSGGKEKKIKAWLDTVSDALDYVYIYEHMPSKGKNAGILCEDLIYKKRGILMLKDFVRVDHKDKRIIKTQHVTSIFSNDWWQGIASEGNSTLKNGKKPEILIKTLLEMFTNENDIVLDAYLGSGTTAAVAHKMGRKYIGIEQLTNHYNMTKQRLLNVIGGDSTGVSKNVGWDGGGSFISCELADK